MSFADKVLGVNNDLPIRTSAPVHSGKVRSVYWLTEADSRRLIQEQGYDVAPDAPLAIMVISDRISAFDCLWHSDNGLNGIPGKGAALNAIANHWFHCFKEQGLADSHILDTPHPLVWIVQKARPVMIEAIARQFITGSLWRAYSQGEREFYALPQGLTKNQKLPELLITPSTKGILRGIPGVPEVDDVNITRDDLQAHYRAFNFRSPEDVDRYEAMLRAGFTVISQDLAELDQVFVDTKFEFGYVTDASGREKLIYMDEVGTPDSSRIWDGPAYRRGEIVENSKESFRQFLLNYVPDPDVLLNKERMPERIALARDHALPQQAFMALSERYLAIAEKITGQRPLISDNPKADIVAVLKDRYGLIDHS